MNPLFPDTTDQTDQPQKGKAYVLPPTGKRKIEPLHPDVKPDPPEKTDSKPDNPAVELIRRKLDQLYVEEPEAQAEAKEASVTAPTERSKHQQFMYDLSTSGKSLAEIQTAWHAYYAQLTDDEKHQVWQEFYVTNSRRPSAYTQYVTQQRGLQNNAGHTPTSETSTPPKTPAKPKRTRKKTTAKKPGTKKKSAPARPLPAPGRSVADIKSQVLQRIKAANQAQLSARQHVRSLLFGVGVGGFVLIIFLFSFFNQMIIAPFIQPSTAGATPIILNTDAPAPSDTPEVIIPKINLQIPVNYDVPSIDNSTVEQSLESGILHYPTTVKPGQQGNGAFFGHSSNNLFNSGKYKFAFVKLHELVPGDIFYLTYDKKVYSYRVYEKRIVKPTEIWVLNNVEGKKATAALITCDPPGTSRNRLVVWGEQISPDPNANAATAAPSNAAAPQQLANDGPTLWGRFTRWVTGIF